MQKIKSSTLQVVATLDGWVPSLQFFDSDADRLLQASTWAFACLSANATAAASLPPVVQKYEDGRWVRAADTHPLWNVLRSPFAATPGWPRWGWKSMFRSVILQLEITGAAYLRPAYADGRQRLAALYLFRYPSRMTPDEDPYTGLLRCFRYGVEEYGINDVVNLTEASASGFYKGVAPLSVALGAIETDATAALRQKSNLENKIAPGAHIKVSDFFGVGISNEQRNEIVNYLTEEYSGASKDGLPFVTGEGTEITAPQTTRDLQYFETRRFARDELLGVLRTPPPVIGIYENATLQNFEKAISIWWMAHLFPMVDMVYDAINLQAVYPVYGGRVRLWYDLSRTTQIGLLLMGQRLDIAKKIADLGYPANIASAEAGLDLPWVEGLDVVNTALIRAGRPTPTDDPPDESPVEDDNIAPVPPPSDDEEAEDSGR
ncbi:MAG: phage portal protein [Polyangia bacterium]|nr:phage portal protein [Polyangia bacterium]